jgi:hypothetical protein
VTVIKLHPMICQADGGGDASEEEALEETGDLGIEETTSTKISNYKVP